MSAVCLYLGFISLVIGYENIALNKPAHQMYRYTRLSVALTEASNAVDGLKSNLSVWGEQCVISGEAKQTATWWVNLTNILSIHHVTIYYRTGNAPWGPSNGFTKRFLGFSLYVLNTTKKSEGSLCFKDTHFTLSTIPAVFNTTCPVHGQYVIYYNERLSGANYPDDYSQYAHNELSEVEVFGCKTPAYYGSNCDFPCPDPNCHLCHIEPGTCNGCKPGYQGHQCELDCPYGYFGQDCASNCSSTCTGCNNVNGSCDRGCHPGWMGDYCQQPCEDGRYGTECSKVCGTCFQLKNCHHINGSCMNGCDRGFDGMFCKKSCLHGYYGYDCNNTCNGACKGCDAVYGLCNDGCMPGWKGDYCQEECDKTYGPGCAETCGHCFDSKPCHHINGSCVNGCAPGFLGDTCMKACDNAYGLGCREPCGNRRRSPFNEAPVR
uniref:Multiple epidermal growth factor-like domains protein 10 n=1 Tax=Crassostrea virginica TaxID=6565 RepID=A0A8B8BXV7_CRAVI|nr:multiple epidermal growth factor-like domains protein 10 [Crassostrea virginica]